MRQKTVKYPAGEYFTVIPFISTLNINQFPLGWFPHSLPLFALACLSSLAVCFPLLKWQPLPEREREREKKKLNLVLCSGTARRTSATFGNVSSCFATLKMQMSTLGLKARELRLLLGSTKAIILEMSEQMSKLTCGFYARWAVSLWEAAEIRAHL